MHPEFLILKQVIYSFGEKILIQDWLLNWGIYIDEVIEVVISVLPDPDLRVPETRWSPELSGCASQVIFPGATGFVNAIGSLNFPPTTDTLTILMNYRR